MLLLAGVADLVIFLTMAAYEIVEIGIVKVLTATEVMGVTAMGFGNAVQLILVAPIVLLFSYTRTHKNKLIDIFIPIVGIVCILLLYLQGGYQIIHIMPLPKINLDEITELLNKIRSVTMSLITGS